MSKFLVEVYTNSDDTPFSETFDHECIAQICARRVSADGVAVGLFAIAEPHNVIIEVWISEIQFKPTHWRGDSGRLDDLVNDYRNSALWNPDYESEIKKALGE